jgi:hypothetical protein
MTNIAIIWALFFFIFVILGIHHSIQSRKEYPLFKIEVDEGKMVSFYNAIEKRDAGKKVS